MYIAYNFILFFCALCFLLKKDKLITVAAISLIGIMSFNLIFEARARYVIIYVPIFIVLAVISLSNVSSAITRRIPDSAKTKSVL